METNGGWVRVEERLPPPGDLYWVVDEWKRIQVAWRDVLEWTAWDDRESVMHPTHWAEMIPPTHDHCPTE